MEITGKMLHHAHTLADISTQYETWESITDEARLRWSLTAVYLVRELTTHTQKRQALTTIEEQLKRMLDMDM